jgi:hypothetical protein
MTRAERRDRKRKKRKQSRRMRGNRRIFLRDMLQRNRYHRACVLKDKQDEKA